jgi:hypothetical protein
VVYTVGIAPIRGLAVRREWFELDDLSRLAQSEHQQDFVWIVSEAIKNYIHRGLRPDVYFWRDSAGHEIDLLIEAGGGKLVPVEAKSGQTFNSEFVKELAWWRNASGLLETTGTVVYGGGKSTTYKDDQILSWRCWG